MDDGFADVVNPTHDEIRAWAHRGSFEPMQDWDIVIAFPENAHLLVELAEEHRVPSRTYLLGSLYCMVGHADHADPRLRSAVARAEESSDPLVNEWGRRARRVMDEPTTFARDDWCGWQGPRRSPEGP